MKTKSRWGKFWADPFRPFFLLGWVNSLLALALWPFFFLGLTEGFPARPHAFLMIQGFFTAFAFGFLWTALPRMMEVPGPGVIRISVGLFLLMANTMFHLRGAHFTGHMLFIAAIGLLVSFAWSRFPHRSDLPPPSFVLVFMGLAAGATGSALVALGESGVTPGYGYRLGRILLMDVFLLFLVLGVSAFLAPRFLEQASRQNMPESRSPFRAWQKEASLAGLAGILILLGAMAQSAGAVRIGSLILAIPVTAYVLYQVPLWRNPSHRSAMTTGLRVALLCTIAAPWLRFTFPGERVAAAHLLLMGGFGLLTLMIGARVVFGHSGYEHLFRARLPSIGVVVGLYLVALLIRLAAEFDAVLRDPLLIASAILLLIAHAVWGLILLPKLLAP